MGIAVGALISAAQSVAVCAAGQIEVAAIANEGFLVTANGKTVLVDALFRATGSYPEFYQQGPSEALHETMIEGGGEFSQVDVALVTHHHADHHDAATALDFLRRHDETILLGTEDVVESMRRLPGFDAVADRVEAPTLRWGQCTDMELNGVGMRVCRAPHSGIPDLSNFVYRAELGDARFVHEGDVELSGRTFDNLGLGDAGLDLAFLHSWWVNSDEGREATLRELRPSRIVLMHHRWSLAQRARDQLGQLSVESRQELPPVTVFGEEMERRSFEGSAGTRE